MKESTYKTYDDLPLFLNAAMVARVLGVAPSSAYELMHEKDFPTLRVGSRMVVPKEQFIEWVFADAKEKHAMRYTQYRGLAQVTNWVKLKFVAMNLKKLATWKWRDLLSSFRFAVFSLIYVRDPVCS